MTEELTLGGWTVYGPLTPADQQVFDEALKGLLGVKYTPTEVSTQLVQGTNYRYKCNASLPQGGKTWEAVVQAYKSLDGTVQLVSITPI